MKNVLITGAASGIGRAVCDAFLDKGYNVYAIDIQDVEQRENQIAFRADITNEDDLKVICDQIDARDTDLDLIINVAGIHRMASLVETDFCDMKRVININLLGTMLVNRVFHKLLVPKGRILIVTSEVASFDPMPFNGLYNVSKSALECYAQALRQELNLLSQKVITIRPGAVETPLSSGSRNDTEVLASTTLLYKKQARRFSGIVNAFIGKPLKPKTLAKTIYRAANAKNPKLVYKKHQSLGLILLNLLPLRWQCGIIKLLLGG